MSCTVTSGRLSGGHKLTDEWGDMAPGMKFTREGRGSGVRQEEGVAMPSGSINPFEGKGALSLAGS